jgi:hypothetical protein
MTEQPTSPDEQAYVALSGGARPVSGRPRPGRQVSRGVTYAGAAVLLLLALLVLLAVVQG